MWTTWKGRIREGSSGESVVKQCIDYILYGERVAAVSALELFTNQYMSDNNYLPSSVYPSDHIAIAADLLIFHNNKL